MHPHFDPSAKFIISVQSGAEQKSATLRYPTDEEWRRCITSRKYVTRDLGQGKTQSQPDKSHTKASVALFDLIAKPINEADFDEEEKGEVIGKLELCQCRSTKDVLDTSKSGDIIDRAFVCFASAPIMFEGKFRRAWTVHRLKLPTVAQRGRYSEALLSSYRQSNMMISTPRYEPLTALYDELVISKERFVGDAVPGPIKISVVSALVDTYRDMIGVDEDPELEPLGAEPPSKGPSGL